MNLQSDNKALSLRHSQKRGDFRSKLSPAMVNEIIMAGIGIYHSCQINKGGLDYQI